MENATFHWLLQGSSKDLEVLLYELDDEGLLGAKMPRPDGMSDEENNLRQLADRHQRIARALVYGGKAFSTALPLALLTLASTRLLEKTTDIQANERDLKSWPDRVEYFFDSINIEESGMTVRSINRLKRFLSKTLPALQDAGAHRPTRAVRQGVRGAVGARLRLAARAHHGAGLQPRVG